ncbi:MAG: hypothetical protein MHM6MM_005207, partial [Cercozoa sp. M6MM]
MSRDFVLVDATVEDAAKIRDLVIQLAVYEKEEARRVKITTEELQDSMRDGLVRCTLAKLNDDIVGIALFHYAFSTWDGRTLYLEDLFVLPEARGKGIGKALLMSLVQRAYDENLRRISWVALDVIFITSFCVCVCV